MSCSALVVLSLVIMMRSINFDDEAMFRTAEVKEVWAERVLAAELESVQSTVAYRFPEH